jgi:hypothetical protein
LLSKEVPLTSQSIGRECELARVWLLTVKMWSMRGLCTGWGKVIRRTSFMCFQDVPGCRTVVETAGYIRVGFAQVWVGFHGGIFGSLIAPLYPCIFLCWHGELDITSWHLQTFTVDTQTPASSRSLAAECKVSGTCSLKSISAALV